MGGFTGSRTFSSYNPSRHFYLEADEECHGDDLKFRSSMTLFASVASDNQVFNDALNEHFDGKPDPLTLERL
jgi:uncharacterized protein (DUF1810 family)